MGRNYKICPRCGDHLDHGERCECMDRRRGSGGPRTMDKFYSAFPFFEAPFLKKPNL